MNSNEDGKTPGFKCGAHIHQPKNRIGNWIERDFEILEFKEYWTRRKKKFKTDVTTGLGPEISLMRLLKNAEYYV